MKHGHRTSAWFGKNSPRPMQSVHSQVTEECELLWIPKQRVQAKRDPANYVVLKGLALTQLLLFVSGFGGCRCAHVAVV